jgi:hypothetical protein
MIDFQRDAGISYPGRPGAHSHSWMPPGRAAPADRSTGMKLRAKCVKCKEVFEFDTDGVAVAGICTRGEPAPGAGGLIGGVAK